MTPTVLCLILGFAACCLAQPSKSNTPCLKDIGAVYAEGRDCGNPCSTKSPCKNRKAKCRCDGACGMVCIAEGLTCNVPDGINNGKIEPVGKKRFPFGASISYTCDKEYELIGPEERQCQGDESWSGIESFCNLAGVKCTRPPFVVENGFADITDKDLFYPNDVVEYTCRNGYSVAKSSTTKTKCSMLENKETEWSPAIKITCIPRRCVSPPPIEDGDHEGSEYTYGKEIVYRCNPGFLLNGRETQYCTSDGTWSYYPPKCEVIKCDEPTVPEHASVRYKNTEYKSTVWYSCEEGFRIIGTDHVVCSANGEWSGDAPTCEVIDCGKPTSPERGSVTQPRETTWNAKIEYSCDEGTSSTGEMSAICSLDQDGEPKWSMPPPVCLGNCDINSVENAIIIPTLGAAGRQRDFSFVKHGTSAQMQCHWGYEMLTAKGSSKETIVCQDGVWSPHHQCTPVPCPCRELPKENLKRDNVELTTTCHWNSKKSSGEFLELRCNQRYPELKRKGSLQCMKGKWMYESFQCQEKSCHVESNLENGKISFSKSGRTVQASSMVVHGTNVHIQCFQGYELASEDKYMGKDDTIICNNGSLGKLPACKEERCSCGNLRKELENKSVMPKSCQTFKTSGSISNLQCANGYSLESGAMTASCKMGTWSQVRGRCKEKCACKELASSLPKSIRVVGRCHDRTFDSEATVNLKCDSQNAKSKGNPEAVCRDGSWDEIDFHCYSNCSLPTNGHRKYEHIVRRGWEEHKKPYVQHEETVRVKCDENYKLTLPKDTTLEDDSYSLKCIDGEFEFVPSCERGFSNGCNCEALQQTLVGTAIVANCSDSVPNETVVTLKCSTGSVHSGGWHEILCTEGQWYSHNMECTDSPGKEVPDQEVIKNLPSVTNSYNPQYHITTKLPPLTKPSNKDIFKNKPEPTSAHSSTNKEGESSDSKDSQVPMQTRTTESSPTLDGCARGTCIQPQDVSTTEKDKVPAVNENSEKHCSLNRSSTITAFYNHEEITELKTIPDGATVTYRCSEIGQYTFYGASQTTCKNGRWTPKPYCQYLVPRSRSAPPVIQYNVLPSTDEQYISEDGALNVPEGSKLVFSCLWFRSYGNVIWSTNATDSGNLQADWNTKQDEFQLTLLTLKTAHSGVYTCTNSYKHYNSIPLKVFSQTKDTRPTTASVGVWEQPDDHEMNTMQPKPCAVLPLGSKHLTALYNGMPLGSIASLPHDAEIWYKCDDFYSYKLIGRRDSKCIDGKWTSDQPICERTDWRNSESNQSPSPNRHYTAAPATTQMSFPGQAIGQQQCTFVPINDVVAFYGGKELRSQITFLHGSIIRFRCNNVFFYEFVGSHSAKCNNGYWSSKPNCQRLPPNTASNKPPLFLENEERKNFTITEDGLLIIPPKDQLLLVGCYTRGQPVVSINEIQQDYSQVYPIQMEQEYIYVKWIRLFTNNVKTIKIGCSHIVRSSYQPYYYYSVYERVTILKVSEVCNVNEPEWQKNGEIIIPSTKRQVYTEGDIITMMCTPRVPRNYQIPEFKKCLQDGRWEASSKVSCAQAHLKL